MNTSLGNTTIKNRSPPLTLTGKVVTYVIKFPFRVH